MTEDSESLDLETSYYMCRVRGRGSPTKSHLTLAEAKTEAERLCKNEKKPVWVLQAIAVVRPQDAPVDWADIPSGTPNGGGL